MNTDLAIQARQWAAHRDSIADSRNQVAGNEIYIRKVATHAPMVVAVYGVVHRFLEKRKWQRP